MVIRCSCQRTKEGQKSRRPASKGWSSPAFVGRKLADIQSAKRAWQLGGPGGTSLLGSCAQLLACHFVITDTKGPYLHRPVRTCSEMSLGARAGRLIAEVDIPGVEQT